MRRGAGASRSPVVWRRVVKEPCPRARADESVPAAANRRGSFGGRDRTCIAGFRGQRPAFRRPRIELRVRRPGGDRTLASPGKSRVRCRYASSLLSRGGTQGSRTLIPPVKSRVLCPLSERPAWGAVARLVLYLEFFSVRIGYTPPVLRRSCGHNRRLDPARSST